MKRSRAKASISARRRDGIGGQKSAPFRSFISSSIDFARVSVVPDIFSSRTLGFVLANSLGWGMGGCETDLGVSLGGLGNGGFVGELALGGLGGSSWLSKRSMPSRMRF